MTTAIILLAISLLILDCLQTRSIFRNSRGEINSVIRWAYKQWGYAGINGYFTCWVIGVLAFHVLVPYGFIGSLLVALVQTIVTTRNHLRGVRI